jgi:hypothetical protein
MPEDSVNVEKHIKSYLLNTSVIIENAKLSKITLHVQSFASHYPDVSTDPVLASTDILDLKETWKDSDETVPVEGYKYITQFKRQDVRAGAVVIYEKNNATMATPHLLIKLNKQNMAKTSFKFAASESCGDFCAAECLANGQKVLTVIVHVPPNTPSDDWTSLIFSNLTGYSPKVCEMFKFLVRRGC